MPSPVELERLAEGEVRRLLALWSKAGGSVGVRSPLDLQQLATGDVRRTVALWRNVGGALGLAPQAGAIQRLRWLIGLMGRLRFACKNWEVLVQVAVGLELTQLRPPCMRACLSPA